MLNDSLIKLKKWSVLMYWSVLSIVFVFVLRIDKV